MKRFKGQTILVMGGDGYLGWTLGLAFARRTDANVIIVDSLVMRNKWEKEENAKLLVKLDHPKARVKEYKRIFGRDNLSFVKVDLNKYAATERLIRTYRPSVIINAAQQHASPYSMKSPKHAAFTFTNNVVGHLNVLWAIAKIDKSIQYIKLGSAGCYMDTDTDFVPLEKQDFTFTHNNKKHKVLQGLLPMQAGDFYHQSKITDYLIDDLCAKLWGLKIITVQQATIFGATIPENHDPGNHKLSARFNYDAIFGTVMNRFVCQLAIGHPLTVYGDGTQKTGLISLRDTVDNFLALAGMRVKPGEHVTIHNYSIRLSIKDIAERIAAADPAGRISYLKNPRIESDGELQRRIEVHPAVKKTHSSANEQKFQDELVRMVEFTKRHKDNIDKSVILPKVEWGVSDKAANSSMKKSRLSLKSLKLLLRLRTTITSANSFDDFRGRIFQNLISVPIAYGYKILENSGRKGRR